MRADWEQEIAWRRIWKDDPSPKPRGYRTWRALAIAGWMAAGTLLLYVIGHGGVAR